jgi:hypothetical protein
MLGQVNSLVATTFLFPPIRPQIWEQTSSLSLSKPSSQLSMKHYLTKLFLFNHFHPLLSIVRFPLSFGEWCKYISHSPLPHLTSLYGWYLGLWLVRNEWIDRRSSAVLESGEV